MSGKVPSKSRGGFRQLLQGGQRVTQHERQIQGPRRLIQGPERLSVVRIRVRRAVEAIAAGSLRGLRPFGPEHETRPTSRVGPVPVGRGDQREVRSAKIAPWPEHDAIANRRSTRIDAPNGQASETMRRRSNSSQLSFNNRRRSANRRRAPASLQRIPAWRKRAWITCLWALSTAPLPIP